MRGTVVIDKRFRRVQKTPKRDGAALVEFAIICPVLFILIVGIVELGLASIICMKLQFSAEAAARCLAIKSPCLNTRDATTYAADDTNIPGITSANFSAVMMPCGSQVSVSYTYTFTLLPFSIPFSTTVCYP